jgi:predicted esterase YcpF (UPF0227 family)
LILFIHGFGSCGWGEKSLQLRRHFGLNNVLAPDLPFDPLAAIAHLQDLVTRYPISALVGSSLGGFLATCLNASHALPSILINPVVRPHLLLAGHLGTQHRWCDGLAFVVESTYLDALLQLHRDRIGNDERYLVLLQQGDEVLDYRKAAAYYADQTVILQSGGNHRFEHFGQQLPAIEKWLQNVDVMTKAAENPQ